MATRARGELRCVAPGHVYTLRLAVEGCLQVEAESGVTWDTLVRQANKGQAKAVRWLLWTAVQPYHGQAFASIESVGTLIDALGGLPAARTILADLLAINADDSRDTKPARGRSGRIPPPPKEPPWQRWYLQLRGIGLDPDAFWSLSLKELWWELAAARHVERSRHDATVKTAWYAAALVWQKRLPDLPSLLAADPWQDPPDLLEGLQKISELYRIPLQVRRADDPAPSPKVRTHG